MDRIIDVLVSGDSRIEIGIFPENLNSCPVQPLLYRITFMSGKDIVLVCCETNYDLSTTGVTLETTDNLENSWCFSVSGDISVNGWPVNRVPADVGAWILNTFKGIAEEKSAS